jgi:hypothetical protein
LGEFVMFETAEAAVVSGRDLKNGANVVDVGAWLASAQAMGREFADYVPRHRTPGPPV